MYNTNNYDPSIIAERIKSVTYSKNITIKEVLTVAGLSANYINIMQHDNRQPRLSAIARICDVLDISLDTLLSRTPTPTLTAAEPLDLDRAIEAVATAAGVTSDALKAVLHL